MLTEQTRTALKAKAYILDVLSSLVPSDPEFSEVWDMIPERIAAKMELTHAPVSAEYIDLAEKVRRICERHSAARADRREG